MVSRREIINRLAAITGFATLGVLMTGLHFESQAQTVVRKAAVAGQFYPENADSLRDGVKHYLAGTQMMEKSPRMLICPHAGYVFSGPVAGKGYAVINSDVKKVIIIGPSHHFRFDGIALPDADYYETPLGKVKIDKEIIGKLRKSPLASASRGADNPEHCLEVQLPFLQTRLSGGFSLVPVLTGDIKPSQLAELIFPLIDEQTIVIASSDLSHYHSQSEARKLDDKSIETILSGDAGGFIDGCGETAIRTVMYLAAKLKLKPCKLDSRTSFETAPQYGSRSRVVGYATIVYTGGITAPHKEKTRTSTAAPKPPMQQFLLKLARESLEGAVKGIKLTAPEAIPAELKENSGCFVTLTINGNLRGCIGYIEPVKPLYQAIIENAANAALKDPRFKPVTIEEIGKIDVEVSVLSKPVQLAFENPDDLLSKLIPGVHGVILQYGPCQSTFLPQVWEQLPDKIMFLEHLSMKGGMPRDGWKTANVKIYSAEHFKE